MKKFPFMIVFLFVYAQFAYAVLTSPIYPNSVRDVKTLAIWLQENFEYQDELNGEYWKTPEETVKDKGGDCEDFAILASKVLTDLKIRNYILVITFKHLDDAHAICIFQNEDGTWSLFSNNTLFGDKADGVKKLLTVTFSDWNKAFFSTPYRHYYYMMVR